MSPLVSSCAPSDGVVLDRQRMEALAQVVGGIAPALSDLLTVIRGQASGLLDAADAAPATKPPLTQIYTAAEKAGSLIRQMLIFSQQQPMHAAIIDLNGLIEDTSAVLRRLAGEVIAVEFRRAPGLPPILADAGMIEQVLVILTLNARDAMPHGGRLVVTTEAVNAADASSEKRVVLTVADTGCGIAPEVLPRIFEPFFTTKPGGRSTGLGLATVFGIAQLHHGSIAVENVDGAGARFKLSLPASPGVAATSSHRPDDIPPGGGRETILLVEDDPTVRDFTAAILQEYGYRVLQAPTSADALEAWKWHGPRVRLLLTDLVLDDGMHGLELAARLRADRPALPVICTSGHSREITNRFPALAGGCHFLPKPCRPQTLLATMRALLDGKTP
jgi:two-component system cell cycle sensor histidine kinase/response regulator CckA